MKATELKSVLTDLADVFRAGATKTAADDVQRLADRIDVSGDASVDDALSALEAELTQTDTENLTAKRYIKEFHDAGLDEKAFDTTFARFKSDKAIKKAEAVEVMKGYAGEFKRARTKAEAVEAIERRFAELLYDDNSHRQAANTTPW